MKKTIAILGATGHIGSKITDILFAEGHSLKLISRKSDKLDKYKSQNVEIIEADITNYSLISDILKNADSAFVLTPPNLTAENHREYQQKIGESIVKAIQKSGLKQIVNLSSCGAHLQKGNGPMAGLSIQEIKLNQLEDVNIVHLRPGYFLENILYNISLIKQSGFNASVADPHHEIPMVYTGDIAKVAANYLKSANFKGKTIHPILGSNNYSFSKITKLIGEAINQPNLGYIQLPAQDIIQALLQQGISKDMAKEMTDMEIALKNGIMNYEMRTDENTTETSAQEFIEKVFLPLYNQN